MENQLYKIYLCFAIFCSSFCKTEASEMSNNRPSTDTSAPASDVLVVVGSTGLNLTNLPVDYQPSTNLFKLNTDSLFTEGPEDKSDANGSINNGLRETRKINFLKSKWGTKPKISPLYLINGTVCRFINSFPICTTLSTTGILPVGNSSGPNSPFGNQFGGNGGEQQIPFQNQQNQGPANQQQQRQQPLQQPRPSAILDDDSQDINVESSNLNDSTNANVTESSTSIVRQQQVTFRPVTNYQPPVTMRPPSLVFNRRPLNLMTFRRPLRQFAGMRGRANEIR